VPRRAELAAFLHDSRVGLGAFLRGDETLAETFERRRLPNPHKRKETTQIESARKSILAVGLVGTALAGGVLGASVFAPTASSAQTSTTTPATGSSTATTPAAGTFHPNEDATHEASESAAREAQENAGQVPTVP
jgi:hypothetical protein